MVTNNKVLTVSYGTFSCTLEGFDNSFDAMKAIAEYFRDLAADDRYFGAEPPTPDAEMLARIAEREIERRVSARTEAGAIYLSANAQQEAASPAPAPAPAPAENSVTETPSAPVEAPEAPESVAQTPVDAPLQEAVQEEAAPEAPAPEAKDETPISVEPVTIADEETSEPEIEDVTDEILQAVEIEANTPETISEEEGIETPEDAPAEMTFAEAEIIDPDEAFEPEEDSIAAKLQRIRAVVSKSAHEPEDDDFSEDEHAESVLTDARNDIESVLQLDDDIAADTATEETPEPARPLRARVLRMKKSDLEAAASAGLLEAEADDDDEDEAPTTLSPEDEAELLAELAQVEAELNRTDAEPENTAPVAPKRPKALDDAGTDVSRLLREADSQLDEPEGNRRRQAIAHLRAAVAATKADKQSGTPKPTPDQTEAYREDLASVMGVAPKQNQPTPLKLVAEQRIDADDAQDTSPAPAAKEAPDTPVRPRRVSTMEAPSGDATDSTSFAEFAENMGATRLPDLLEAAAAYLTYVEGRERFSRPMVMRMAHDIDEENFNREDTLRSFGQLLRENKIAKLKGGRFTASENIGFKPEERAVG